jgi:uncharacterized oligopeptide transporter (OPT) family protein
MPEDPQAELKSIEQRDREWLATVYRGDKEKDLTIRAVLAGMIFGGLMSLSNLYVGLKTGWGLGVDIAAVVVIFAVFKTLRSIGLVRREFGLMENTMMMTVAVAASWISSAGLVSAVPALTMLTGYQFVPWQLALFIAVILYLGLVVAIPLKRQMIQVDSLRFPANIPTGETLLVMYSHGGQAMKKAVSLGIAAVAGIIVAGLRDGLGRLPNQFSLPLRLKGVAMSKLTLGLEPSLIFVGIGALFGMKVGLSMLLGVVVNYGILAPQLIEQKIIRHDPPKLLAVTTPKMPLTIEAGQSLAVRLEEARTRPEFPTPEELKADPQLASSVTSEVLKYTWTRHTVYSEIAALVGDLNARSLQDGSPNPLHGVLKADEVLNKKRKVEMLVLEASAATTWEAKLSLPKDQPAGMLTALGFNFDPNVEKEGVTEADAAEAIALQKRKALSEIGGFKNISAWSLWPGAMVLVVGGLLALAFQWRTMGRTFASIFTGFGGKRDAAEGSLDHIEIPMSWFVVGFLITGTLAVLLLSLIFSIHWWMSTIAVVLTFFLAAVAARAGAEIGINPIGAMGKVTQLTYGALAPGNITANLMTAGLTAGAACSCSDTVGNLKVGHMVGANPRKQFVAQLFGVLAGALLAVPAYFILVPDADKLGGEQFPAPSALVWMGVAKVLSKGLHTLPPGAVLAMAVAFVLGTLIVVVDHFFPKAKPYTPSPAALGIALTIPGSTGLAMFLGALIAWSLEKRAPKWHDMYTIPIASGGIAGESIMGVVLAAISALTKR